MHWDTIDHMTLDEKFPTGNSRTENVEIEPTPNTTHIRGLGIVRCDLVNFDKLPELPLIDKAQLIEHTGSRQWVIATPAEGAPWQSVLDGISSEYLIHMIEAYLGDRELSPLEVNSLKTYIRESVGKQYSDQFTMYRNGGNGLMITSEDIHLSTQIARVLMHAIEDWLTANT